MSKKPDKQRVLETYYHEVQKRGSWGAFTRTAAVHHLSDETIRRYVKQLEEPAPVPDDALAYIPCPGEKPAIPRELPQKVRRKRSNILTLSHSRMCRHYGFLRQAVRANVEVVAQMELPQSPMPERVVAMLPPTRIIYRDLTPQPSLTAQLWCWLTQPGFLLAVLVASVLILLSRW